MNHGHVPHPETLAPSSTDTCISSKFLCAYKSIQKFSLSAESPIMQVTRIDTVTPDLQTSASIPQAQKLREKKARDLITDKRRLVEVPYTASLADTINALTANRVSAVPVAAPPGHWIGAGGSMILESDKLTGAARKHYIGMVTMVDVLGHIAGNHVDTAGSQAGELERKMQVQVSSIIGHCLESLSLWTLNSNTSILDCMEVFSKGIHRALIPVESHVENIAGVELVESAFGYRMLTQMDLLKFLKAHEHELRGILAQRVRELGSVSDVIFGITDETQVIDAIKCMNMASLNAVPIVKSVKDLEEDHRQLINGKGRELVGTFSSSDLQGCPISQLESFLQLNVVQFFEKLSETPLHRVCNLRNSIKDIITCHPQSPLQEVVDKVINNHVHRVWVVDEQGLLAGLVSLTDIIRVIRGWMLSGPAG